MKLVLIDAYDSFTYNLAQAFWTLGATVEIVRCDAVDAEDLGRMRPDQLVFGPGPGRPEEAGCMVSAIRSLAGEIPILGICLGHQGIALAFGGEVVRHAVVHGHATPIHHEGSGLFAGLPPAVAMTRYHSLVVAPEALPPSLRVTAWSDDGGIMALSHRTLPVHGVQFHPESVLSAEPGLTLLRNFLTERRAAQPRDPVFRASA